MNDDPTPSRPAGAGQAAPENLRTLTAVVYGLQAGVFLIGLSAIVAVVINYVKRDEVAGTWLESHFRWQIRTFWYSMLWYALGALTFFIFIGYLLIVFTTFWVIYRIIKGWLYLYDNKPMYA